MLTGILRASRPAAAPARLAHRRRPARLAHRTLGVSAAAVAVSLVVAGPAAAQTPPAQPPPPPPPSPLTLAAPKAIATGVGFAVRGTGAAAGERVRIEIRVDGRWARLARARADASGSFDRRVSPRRPRPRMPLRAVGTDGRASPRVTVRSRDVTLASVGDINLGDGPGAVIAVNGARYPWTSVAPTLRAADIAFGNLECAVSTRGGPVPKQFTFRGHPAWLRPLADYAGFDVLNLANNHVGDYGTAAMLDTIANVRRLGMKAVGAGGSLASAAEPRIVTRLGLRVAFVGFSNILPAEFFAGPDRAGTQPATPELIRASVAAAKRRADVVVATFHWGVERAPTEDGTQRAFAAEAFAAGASAVIGAHPHVLQPIRTAGPHRLVAYSLGNFVFGAGSPGTTTTGILKLRLSTRGVEGSRLIPAVIEGTRPRLTG